MSQWARAVMSGADRSLKAAVVRGATAVVEPAYAGVMRARNRMYDAAVLRAVRLDRPVVSVGNLTTGGTGKTPVVRWLADRFADRGVRAAVLMRGYKGGGAGGDSDERAELAGAGVIAEAEPDRVEGARHVIATHPDVGVFLLDDGFQHRRVRRDFDLVLVNAAEPFGFGRVLPRGLLREPLAGLRRADAVVVTRADQVSAEELAETERAVRRYSKDVPIYRAAHVHVGVRDANGVKGMQALRGEKFFAFAGIGNPECLGKQLAGDGYVGHRWFADHYGYSARDLAELVGEARRAGAGALVTTEKDWVKVSRLGDVGMPVWRLELEVRFEGDGGHRLIDQVWDRTLGKSGGMR